ncbi:hypothetical protein BV20DRAFT_1005687 [Pilatotrama ljubarskyi]|nr:hypothetical protein BV20DRAFT_1005687 [Pilatotrama ljubarskyi]
MGVSTLVGERLPPHPNFPTGEAPYVVPIDAATGEAFLRFRWDKDAKHPSNAPAINKVLLGVRTLGPTLYPGCAVLLPSVLEAHLKERVLKKYKYLHNEWSRENRTDETSREDEEDAEAAAAFGLEHGEEEDGGVKDRSAKPPRNKRATHNSRVASKLAILIRKRKAHPEYSHPKYDAAFIANAMSEEEDDPEVQGGEGKRYISHAPDYRSEQLTELYAALEASDDPEPDKSGRGMVPRVRGDVIVNAVPPKAKVLKNRLRAWQVKPELLDKHPEWLTSGRVAANGTLWGEAEDPVDMEPKKRKEGPCATAVTGALRRKRRQVDTKAVAKTQEELDVMLGGQSVTDLIDRFSG